MKFEWSYIPAIAAILVVYVSALAGLLKNDIKGIYRRRVRREKLLTVGILGCSFLIMLLFASRQEGIPESLGLATERFNEVIFWIFHQDIQIVTLAEYCFLGVPIIIIGTSILEVLGMKYEWMRLPFYYYLLLFIIPLMFYHPLRTPISGWLVSFLVIVFLYCLIETIEQGKNKKKVILLVCLVIMMVVITVWEQGIAYGVVLRTVALIVENILAAILINRSGILRKTLWHLVTLICFAGLFILHFYTSF
ncbi:hypothetical protein [Roseburia inulinivorans]